MIMLQPCFFVKYLVRLYICSVHVGIPTFTITFNVNRGNLERERFEFKI